MDQKKRIILKKSIIPINLELKNRLVKYNDLKDNMTNKEQEQREKYLALLEEFSIQREELQNRNWKRSKRKNRECRWFNRRN